MKKAITTLAAALLCMTASLGQSLTPLRPDSAVLQGTLPNGLTYIIRHNELPKDRASFYIAQKVGAILEEDNQNGLAHFLEHMAFNGTKNFPGKKIINFLEHAGVRFGENINAFTSLDETVYNLADVPTTDPSIVDSALLVLHDWSGFISLEGDEIDKERGVIREEWRARASASRRLYFAHNRNTMPGTPYAKRDVIGDTAIINNFKYDELRAYYKKWYRPDLQGIVVVGDIDPKAIEKRIKEMWQDIPAPVNAAKREYFDVPISDKPVVSIESDKEATSSSFRIDFRYKATPTAVRNTEEYVTLLFASSICSQAINIRLTDIARKPDAPIVYASMGSTSLTPTLDATLFVAQAKGGKLAATADLVLTEMERLRRYGITEGELNRAKTTLLKAYEDAYVNRGKVQSESYVGDYYNSFLEGDVITSREYEYELSKKLIPGITTDMVNSLTASRLNYQPTFVISTMESEADNLTAEECLKKLRAVRADESIAPMEEEDIDMRIVKDEPKPGRIVKRGVSKTYDTRWIELSNGLKVYLKPTTLSDNQIIFGAYSNGGYSAEPSQKLFSAAYATSIRSVMGLGDHSASEMVKVMTGKRASVTPSIGMYTEQLSGSCSKKDLETMLQLTYMAFSEPRIDKEAYESMMSRLRTQLLNLDKNPNKAFSDSISRICADGNPYLRSLSEAEQLDEIDMQDAADIYRRRFASAKGFTFVFVGTFDPDSIETLLCKWIGGLDTKTKRSTKPVDRDCYYPQRDISCVFDKKMTTEKTSCYIVYSHKDKYDRRRQIALQMLQQCLDMRYLESIREDEGGSYGVSVSCSLDRGVNPESSLTISFTTDPKAYDRLYPIVEKEIRTIAEQGPRADDMAKIKSQMIKGRKDNLQKNSTWLSLIKGNVLFGDDDTNYEQTVNDISPEEVQKWAKTILEKHHKVKVVMHPAQD